MALVVETDAAIGVTRLSRWIFNCYLIHDGGDGTPAVVDAGLPGLVDDLEPVMAGLGLDIAAIGGVFATHGHSDHVSGAPALSARSRCAVHLPAGDRAYLAGEVPRTPGPASVARIWPTVLDQPFDASGATQAARGAKVAGYGSRAGMRWPAPPPVDFLAGGDRLPGASAWQVLAAAGHTDDSIAFWHEGTRTLLSGDAVLTVGGRAWMTPETVDGVAGRRAAERLRALDVDHLLPGHGRPVSGRGVTAQALGPEEWPAGAVGLAGRLGRRLIRPVHR